MSLPKVCCVWYPAGGFGHFVNSILTLYGDGFVRPAHKQFDVGASGDWNAGRQV